MNKERFQNIKSIRLVAIALSVILIVSGFKVIQDNSVTIEKREIKNGVALYASNSNYYPVTIELDAELTNMTSSESNPLITVLNGRSKEKLLK